MPDSAWWDKVRADRDAPRYWRTETSGVLREPIRRLLANESLLPEDFANLRAYLQQWVNSSAWDANPHQTPDGAKELRRLRQDAKTIHTREDILAWLKRAESFGVDPL